MSTIGFSQDEHARWAAPGHWNDPDMLEVGNGGMTNDEYRTHLSLWSILAAPLLAGNDLRNMSEATREILTNREVVAIDQDMNGAQGRRIARSDDWEIWAKALSNGALAIGLFNRGRAASQITIKWSDLGLKPTPTHGRDLWGHRDLKLEGAEYSVTVPAHGVVMLRVYN
jgi:alpha-galactosidase